MSMNVRCLPPTQAGKQSINVNGRNYSCAVGSFIDVPDFDAQNLGANGWTCLGPVGPSSSRPSTNYTVNPPYVAAAGVKFIDTTIGKVIFHDGVSWRDPIIGNAV
jgi:hypothetical protein